MQLHRELVLVEQPETEEIPEVTKIDELETFIGSKKIKFGYRQPSITVI